MTKSEQCIHKCGRNASAMTDECTPCRSGFGYWKRKTARERLDRRNQLDVLSSRLDTHFDVRGKKNEEPLVQPEPVMVRGKLIVTRERKK